MWKLNIILLLGEWNNYFENEYSIHRLNLSWFSNWVYNWQQYNNCSAYINNCRPFNLLCLLQSNLTFNQMRLYTCYCEQNLIWLVLYFRHIYTEISRISCQKTSCFIHKGSKQLKLEIIHMIYYLPHCCNVLYTVQCCLDNILLILLFWINPDFCRGADRIC